MSNRIDLGNLELQLIEKINQSPNEFDVGALSVALTELRNARINSVDSFDDLPASSENIGKIYYVVNQDTFYIGFDKFWAPSFSAPLAINLFTWGNNGSGRLGDGSTTSRASPGTTAGCGTTWCQIDMGYYHSTAIKTDGTLWTWGLNQCGPLGDGTTNNRSSPGTIAGAGTDWCQASGGDRSSAAIKTDGTLWTWGFNSVGQLGDGSSTNRSSPVTVAGGGTTWCQVSTDACNTAALKTDGTLWTWGVNGTGGVGDGTTNNRCSPVTTAGGGTNWCQAIASNGRGHGIKTDGTLWAWGNNSQGRLGDGTTTYRSSPVTVAGGGTNWCQVATNLSSTIAIKTDGTAWTWGYNRCGVLGDGSTTARSSPGTTAGAGTDWCQGTVGRFSMSAIKTDGTIWSWGNGQAGQLATGSTLLRCSPGTIVGNINTWTQVSMGVEHTAGIRISPPSS